MACLCFVTLSVLYPGPEDPARPDTKSCSALSRRKWLATIVSLAFTILAVLLWVAADGSSSRRTAGAHQLHTHALYVNARCSLSGEQDIRPSGQYAWYCVFSLDVLTVVFAI